MRSAGQARALARKSLASRILEHRQAIGMSRSELAKLVGVDPSTVAGWEAGKFRPRDGDHRKKLAVALGIDVGALREVSALNHRHPLGVRLVETMEELPDVLTRLLQKTKTCVKDLRIAAPYTLPPHVQTSFRQETSARILGGNLEVMRVEVFYSLTRLKEVLANVIRYHGCKYHVRSFCPGLDEVVPAMGAYAFDDAHVVLGGYFASVPPHGCPSLVLQGADVGTFFSRFWEEIWRRGTPLNLGGSADFSEIRALALRMGLRESDWDSFLAEARVLKSSDGAPLRI